MATDVPGCREIVRDGQTGFLVPARNADGLAAALRRLIDDAGLRRRFGAAGRAVVEAEFTLERVAAQTVRLYDELTGRMARRAGERREY